MRGCLQVVLNRLSTQYKQQKLLTVDSSQDIMTKIPLEDYQNTKKLSTDVFAGR